MSHEIRTPLGGLLGMMELLDLSRLSPDQRELLGAARSSGNSLLRIVNDILDWSKIEAGKLELAPRAATLSGLLKSVAGTYAQLASEKNLQLELEVDPALGPIHLFDPLRVSQILNNFTSNAIKFTARGTVWLRAQRLAHRAGYDTVCFSVQDSGMGIDQEQQARLFQHYQQASADTARMYGGTGLGLAICRSLAELMGGTLGVESRAGIGSTFSFTVELPVANVALPADPGQPHAPEPDITPLGGAGQPLALLIVDDHPLNRMLLKQQLALLGLRADAAADGAEALSLWQSQHFDLIITDCHMPEMDGYELTRNIRAIEQHTGARRIPIIAWTANVLAEEEQRCRVAGMDDLLTKPTELAELRAKLLNWLVKHDTPSAGRGGCEGWGDNRDHGQTINQ
jgi:CheY-like chemotaxis protein